MKYGHILFAALSMAALTSGLRADTLTGTSVTGSISINGSVNYFDPANSNPPVNSIPPGYLNAAGVTVTVSDSATEFGAAANDPTFTLLLTSDFSANQLLINFQYELPADTAASTPTWVFQFADDAFVNFTLNKLSDTFANGGLNPVFADGVLTLTWPGTSLPASPEAQSGTYSASFLFGEVPEPDTTVLAGLGLAGLWLGVTLARRKSNRPDAGC
ncbi:MAG TPA: PEP-CTERM sorting domain-containing protein [Bryobacteraceae bacterium]|jgi:hypothetical protein|nr:PEP-CTERM sorting domain-containing protein [Bryobacteraceae bacterium]